MLSYAVTVKVAKMALKEYSYKKLAILRRNDRAV